MSGRVVLVGAGPGDPDLLTIRAAREIEHADVLLYDALIPSVILELASPEAELIDVGKRGDGSKGVPQEQIADLLVAKARQGRSVVRLKGGDPFVFGRGGEEASALAAAGIPFEVVPGVSSAIAVPAYAGIPISDRRVASSVAIVTGHRGRAAGDERTDWEALAVSADTLVVLMGTAWIEDIVERVIRGGRAPDTPSAVIASGTRGDQRTVTAALQDLPARVREAGLAAPTIIVIGEVVRYRDTLHWFESRPLFGRSVLVLRSQEQRGPLVLELSRAAARPVAVPLMEFAPTPARADLVRRLARAGEYDWLVFSSANSVRFCADLIEGSPRIACIGEASAFAARRAGLDVEVVPAESWIPSTLVAAMAARGGLRGARVLLPQGDRARDTLAQALRGEGAEVDSVEAYVNRTPEGVEAVLRQALADGVDAFTLTSPSTVERLCEILGADKISALARTRVFACIGPTTADALRARGIEPSVVAEQQSSAGLVHALESFYRENPNGLS